ncbi:GNAT family N-acetyltransferase [Tenacibaculum maritimum]|uniref:Acetyltransferase, GNAT n=1 Tax=Tenacibaculum maritimum NCIMB 2154 TaxID=1349785 RepID=A0A2H1EBU5_9FLAO|nr:GNAT family N-acetyltransferase [Tenacibaculum maritimum]SFZ83403.1 Acetyltransferase, GNAT [Tenacibaculum maritimum NCIMB 2154]
MIEIKKIKASETYAIRIEVLRKGIELPFEFYGDFDENTFHIGAFKENELLGVATFMEFENPLFRGSQYQLRGMAVLPLWRKRRIGAMILEKSLIILRDRTIRVLWCNARDNAAGFYKEQGFDLIGKAFEVKLIGTHFLMRKYVMS